MKSTYVSINECPLFKGLSCIYVVLIPVCGQAIIAIHVLLVITDSLPAQKIAFSILCHVIYLQNFSDSWPLISLTSHSFIASCVLVVVDHFVWFFHFSRLTHQAHYAARQTYRGGPVMRPPAFGEMATFFAICVWLTPLFLFLSLSANDNTLPTSGESRHLYLLFLSFPPFFFSHFLSLLVSPSVNFHTETTRHSRRHQVAQRFVFPASASTPPHLTLPPDDGLRARSAPVVVTRR
jgi:Transmembrane adaptor Erv26